jgi:hypothetical protein
LEGFVGLLQGDRPRYYQVADKKLALRLYDGFRWAITLTQDETIRGRLSAMQQAQMKNRSLKTGKSLSSWKIGK